MLHETCEFSLRSGDIFDFYFSNHSNAHIFAYTEGNGGIGRLARISRDTDLYGICHVKHDVDLVLLASVHGISDDAIADEMIHNIKSARVIFVGCLKDDDCPVGECLGQVA